MPKPKKVESVDVVSQETVEVSPVKGAKVYDTTGHFIREYTKEVHGAEYKELAAQFAGKNGYIVK